MTQITKKAPVEKVKIVKSDVIAVLDAGKTRQELADHYGLSLLQMKAAMKAMNLTHNKAKKITFEIVDDLATETVEAPIVTAPVAETVVTEEAKPTKNVEAKAEKVAAVVEKF